MAEFFTHNIPDEGYQTEGPPGTSVADKFRRFATMGYGMGNHLWSDPARTMLPWAGPVGTVAKQIPALISNHLRNLNPGDPGYTNPPRDPAFVDKYAGQYNSPQDMTTSFLLPGHVPAQELQNLIRQDPLAGLLGPMQKPAPQQPATTPGL
jgi:hypothetical protein